MSTTQQHSEQEQNGQQGPQILDGRATAAAIGMVAASAVVFVKGFGLR